VNSTKSFQHYPQGCPHPVSLQSMWLEWEFYQNMPRRASAVYAFGKMREMVNITEK